MQVPDVMSHGHNQKHHPTWGSSSSSKSLETDEDENEDDEEDERNSHDQGQLPCPPSLK